MDQLFHALRREAATYYFEGLPAATLTPSFNWQFVHDLPWTETSHRTLRARQATKAGMYNVPSPAQIPMSKFAVIEDDILRQCDPQDEFVDNIISAPQQCSLSLEAILCRGTPQKNCLSPAQLGTLRLIYNGYVDVNRTFVFPHLLPGSQLQWEVVIGNGTGNSLGADYARYFVGLGNATADDFDMLPFQEKGGKVLTYHGMADGFILTVAVCISTTRHCSGTPENVNAPWYFAGPNQGPAISYSLHCVPGFMDAEHDILLSLMAWVEKGVAPEDLIATTWHNDTTQDTVYRQRPLCFYPKKAVCTGKGNPDNAQNWKCRSLY
ncbi:hypothetical protein ASPSYDRAFT_37690 [Aspergillus sydowii CBS 593.65]|uniref:Carboxylic ester hydrolase n=1 Tax=Aspergillus sydowii CBS 593.65 TaxID=1036612 RepID=A0A1L9SXN6_9EURO|nr:uncharacterized protein ASPSYDRAFT_37690 [Aspergillus sydowii CBS 593.65]OJJ51965.1 hypothetical protein ASPSYDRAFT_37690 [Aspergillus sydowii CBS 593.65]